MNSHPFDQYLEKYRRWPLRGIRGMGHGQRPIFVVIPAYDEPDLDRTLHSLLNCTVPEVPIHVVIALNGPLDERDVLEQKHRKQIPLLKHLWEEGVPASRAYRLDFVEYFFEEKWAGAGAARKAGADEVIARLIEDGIRETLIAFLDADCTVASNYLVELERVNKNHPGIDIWSIYFEHDLEAIDEAKRKMHIALFELHLRYYRQALHWCGFPHAFHTIGSCMAFRASAYARLAGMNRKKAGEDFYFFQKLADHGRAADLTETCVYPSARISKRVPFGTGRAIAAQDASGVERKTFAFASFEALKSLFDLLRMEQNFHGTEAGRILDHTHPLLASFLKKHSFTEHWEQHKRHTKGDEAFRDRFYQWMGGGRTFKWLHYARARDFPDRPVRSQAGEVLPVFGGRATSDRVTDLLQAYRLLDRRMDTAE